LLAPSFPQQNPAYALFMQQNSNIGTAPSPTINITPTTNNQIITPVTSSFSSSSSINTSVSTSSSNDKGLDNLIDLSSLSIKKKEEKKGPVFGGTGVNTGVINNQWTWT
jgi:hypothetical protein